MNKKMNLIFLEDSKGIIKTKDNTGNLFVLSDDKLEHDDWVYKRDAQPKIFKHVATDNPWYKDAKKVIATTNTSIKIKSNKNLLKEYITIDENLNGVSLPQIPTSFIQYFIEHYNKGNVITKVNVEYVIWTQDIKTGKFSLFINPFNCINIKTVKDSWNKAELLEEFLQCNRDLRMMKASEIRKWIEQNL